MTAAYTCPRCVNLIAYGIPHACALPDPLTDHTTDEYKAAMSQEPPQRRSGSVSKLGSDSPQAVRPGREGAPPDPTSPPPYPLSDPNTFGDAA